MSCCEGSKKRKELASSCCAEDCHEDGGATATTTTTKAEDHKTPAKQHRDISQPLKSLEEWDDWKRDYELKTKPTSETVAADGQVISNGNGSDKSAEAHKVGVIVTDKPKTQFRNYVDGARQQRVEKFYRQQHSQQSYDFVMKMEEKYNTLNHFKMGVWEALEYLSKVVDDSDPDVDLTQLEHALQTAEACRAKWPDEKFDWLHLTGLIHDLGKILAVKDAELGLPGEPQWAVVGDTFPVGLPFDPKNVMFDSFKENPDTPNPKYNQGLGIYSKGCGLRNVHMSYGHDEYIYQVMVGNNIDLPTPALYMLRYHSFYPWHREGAYTELMDDQDREMFKFVKEFNECDLYSKSESGAPSVEKLAPYYKKLIEKYMPGQLNW